MADRVGDGAAHEIASKQVEQGVASFRKKLWNGSYFRLWHDEKRGDNETCLANQLMGQWCCRVAGLDPLFNDVECKSVYASIEKLNSGKSKFGLINGGNFQGDAQGGRRSELKPWRDDFHRRESLRFHDRYV